MNLEFETQDLFVDYLTPDRVENISITGVKDLERLLETIDSQTLKLVSQLVCLGDNVCVVVKRVGRYVVFILIALYATVVPSRGLADPIRCDLYVTFPGDDHIAIIDTFTGSVTDTIAAVSYTHLTLPTIYSV